MLLHVHVHDYGAGGRHGDAALAREGHDSEQQGTLEKEVTEHDIGKRRYLRDITGEGGGGGGKILVTGFAVWQLIGGTTPAGAACGTAAAQAWQGARQTGRCEPWRKAASTRISAALLENSGS